MSDTPINVFLEQLQQEAEDQAKLHTTRVLPQGLDWLTSLIGRYPWQTLLLTSGLTACIISVLSLYE